MADPWADRVKMMRGTLKLSQQHFATLIGVSLMSVNRWENGLTEPKDLGALILEFLSNALGLHSSRTVLDALRRAGADPISLVRALAWLERSRTLPRPPST
jgi:transcriptional regulator with XRE-family HTH domain